jgi:hypothetical protein
MITATRITSLYGIDPHDAPITENKPFLTALTITDAADGIVKTYQQIHQQQFQWDLIHRDDYRILHIIGLKPNDIPKSSNTASDHRIAITDYFLLDGDEEDIYSGACAEEIAEKEEHDWLEAQMMEASEVKKRVSGDMTQEEEARSWAEWWIDKHTPWIGELMLKGDLQNLLTEIITDVYKRLKDVD